MASIDIAGAGILGLWQAVLLQRDGHQVTLWDPGGIPSKAAASRLAGAMLGPFCEGEAGHEQARDLGIEALDIWREIYPATINHGTLVVASARDHADLSRYINVSTGYRRLTGAGVAELEPALNHTFPHGLFYEDEAHVEPQAAMVALAGIATGLGAVLREEAFDGQAKGDWVVDSRGIAAASHLKRLRGVRGERVVIECPDVTLSRPVRLLHPRIPFYIVPWSGGRFMLGASVIESDDSGPPTARSIYELLGAAYALNPAFAEARVIDIGAGVRPAFPDNLPKVVVRGKTLFVNGSHRHGFLLSPILAKAAGDYIREGRMREGVVVEDRVNGEQQVTSAVTLADLCRELDIESLKVATAWNGDFVPASRRDTIALHDGDTVEILSPRQGG